MFKTVLVQLVVNLNFQFYKNQFDPDEKIKILEHENLNKKTLETIINEIFSTDVDENEHIIKNFKKEYDL